MIALIAWKNIWRNKKRSLVLIIALALGVMAGVFSIAFMNGMVIQRQKDIIEIETSDIQVHHNDFLSNYEIRYLLPQPDSLVEILIKEKNISGLSLRTRIPAMIESPKASGGVTVIGIDTLTEALVSRIFNQLCDTCGNFPSKNKTSQILISQKLSEKLKAKLRSKVVLTFQGADSTLTGGAFRIAGLFKTNNSAYDETHVFVVKNELNKLLGIPDNAANEIAIRLNDHQQAWSVAQKLKSHHPALSVQSWKEMSPELAMLNDIMAVSMFFTMGIILLALCFGIINTMLMAVLERTRELGMLMAVGMKKGKVFRMILLETLFLSLTGGLIGLSAGALLNTLLGNTGINLSMWGQGLEAIGYATIIYPELHWTIYLGVTVMVICTGLFAALFPARKALRLLPVEAIRSE